MQKIHLAYSLAAALVLGHSSPSFAQSAPSPAFTNQGGVTIADVAEKTIQSVVNVSATRVVKQRGVSMDLFDLFQGPMGGLEQRPKQRKAQSLGSGVVVSNKGLVITNNHVVENAEGIKVAFNDGREFDAEVVGTDPLSDLAVLKLKGNIKNLKALPYGNSDKLRLGEVVVAIGNPFGVGQTVTMGIVSAKGRTLMGNGQFEDFIQTDAAINPGNSGGALVNMNGELVGINTAILSRSGGNQGIGFAIPTSMVRPIAANLVSDGKVKRGFLGVAIQDLTKDLAKSFNIKARQGVLIPDVVPNGPAAKAGIKRGDVVTSIDDKKVSSATALRNRIAAMAPGKKTKFSIIRNGKPTSVVAKLGELNRKQETEKEITIKGASGASGKGLFKGVKVSSITKSLRQRRKIPANVKGVIVTAVNPQKSSGQINLMPGDILMEINRNNITSVKDFQKFSSAVKSSVAVLVWRNGGTIYQSIVR